MEKIPNFESPGGRAERDDDILRVPGITIKGSEGRARRIIEEEIKRREKEQREKYPDPYEKIKEDSSALDGFLELLQNKGVPVSTPEWLQFLTVVKEKTKPENLQDNDQFLNSMRMSAKIILVKNKEDEAAFHEAFDEYFSMVKKVFEDELSQKESKGAKGEEKAGNQDEEDMGDDQDREDAEDDQEREDMEDNQKKERDSETEPEMKDQLGVKDVDEKKDLPENSEHEDNEKMHGGKEDQHNDILKREDFSKKGGGNKKVGEGEDAASEQELDPAKENPEKPEFKESGVLVGGGKGNSYLAEKAEVPIISEGKMMDDEMIGKRIENMQQKDRRLRYERRPDKASMKEVIRNLRKIITEISEIKSKKVNIKGSVNNFAKLRFRPVYEKEAEKQPEIVLLIDVGGPVDEWSPLMKEVAESMTEGLAKMEIYLFHNNLYGYVWKPNLKDIESSNFAEPNSLIDIKKIVKKRKKVIVYGDGEMSYSEFKYDGWPPRDNEEKVEKFEMNGEDCLNFIKKHSDAAVWINPIFKKEWQHRDDSGTIASVKDIIPMHDLTVGGVEDAIKELMGK